VNTAPLLKSTGFAAITGKALKYGLLIQTLLKF
jgi:hypothetical protein